MVRCVLSSSLAGLVAASCTFSSKGGLFSRCHGAGCRAEGAGVSLQGVGWGQVV